jgi:ABC-2 type transport system permease protein
MTRALHAEWTKLRTVRTTTWTLLALAVVTLLFTALICGGSDTTGCGGGPECNDVVIDSLSGLYIGQFAIVTLGVLAITSEYATGMIRVTFAADPRRRTVLAAKALAVGAAVLVLGAVMAGASYALGRSLLEGNGFTAANGYAAATAADLVRPLAGTALYLTAVALLSLGAGAVLRHAAGAVTTVLAVLIVPIIASPLLPDDVADWVERIGPMTAGLAIQRTVERPDNVPIAPWLGLGVAWLWAALALGLALWLIGRRDA